MCPAYRFRAGDSVSASQWEQSMQDAQRWLGERRVWLNRGDLGLGHEAIMRWHETETTRPRYLFKLKLTSGVRTALHQLPESAREGPASEGAWQVAEGRLQLHGWSSERRVVFARQLQGDIPGAKSGEFRDRHKHEFAVYATNLPPSYNAWQIQQLYRERTDAENVFDELKNQWGFSGFRAKARARTELAARLLLVVYNLWVLFVRFIVPHKHTEAKRGRRWFLVIAAPAGAIRPAKRSAAVCERRLAKIMSEGFARLHEWIRSTAPQLKTLRPHPHENAHPAASTTT